MSQNSDKTLTFKSAVDDKSLKTLNTSLKDIKKGSDDLKKSLDGLTKGFKDLDKELGASVKDLKAFGSTMDATGKSVARAVGHLSRYVKLLGAMGGGGGGSGSAAAAMAGASAGGIGGSAVVGGNGHSGSAGGGGGGGILVPTAGGGYASAGRSPQTPAQQQQAQDLKDLRFKMDMARQLTGMASGAIGTFNGVSTLQNQAQVAQVAGGMLRRLTSGDVGDILAMQRGKGRGAQDMFSAGSLTGVKAQNFLNNSGQVLQGGASGGLGSSIMGGLNGILGATGAVATGADKAKQAQNLMSNVEAGRQMNPLDSIMAEHLQSTAGTQLAMTRRLAGQGYRAGAIGAGYGLGLGESGSYFTGAASRFGSSAVMGSRGSLTSKENAHIITNDEDAAKGTIMGKDKSMSRAWLAAHGYRHNAGGADDTDINSWVDGSGKGNGINFQEWTRNKYGGGKVGIGQSALNMERYGFDRDSTVGMLGQIQMGVGGNKGDAGETATRKLEAVFRKAFAGGIQDVQLQEKIGQAVADSVFGQGGAINNAQQVGFALTGGGNNQDLTMHGVESRIAGMRELDNTNANPLIQTTRMEALKQKMSSMGGNLSQTALLALSNASETELIGGGGNEVNSLLSGLSSEKRTSLIHTARDSGVEMAVSQLANPGLKSRIAKAGDLRTFLKTASSDDRAEIASAMKSAGLFSSFDTAEGGLSVWQNADEIGSAKNGKIGNRRGGLAEASKINGAQSEQKLISETLSHAKEFFDAFKTAQPMFETLKGANFNGWEGATEVIKELENLIKIIQKDPETLKKAKNLESSQAARRRGN